MIVNRRLWCVPAALLGSPGEVLEAGELLAENSDLVGLLLFATVRDVRLWAEAAAGERIDLFQAQAAMTRLRMIAQASPPPEVEVALNTVAAMLRQPTKADPSVVGESCADVARWAAKQKRPLTAVAFSQAAAIAQPEDPRVALQTGLYAFAAGQLPRADTWLRRVIGLARRAHAWDSYTAAYLHLAEVLSTQGRHDGARRAAMKALRSGRRHAVAGVRPAALLGLFRSARAERAHDSAERFARELAKATRREDPPNPIIHLDLARWWSDSQPHRARTVLQRLLAEPLESRTGLIAHALSARTAAHLGDEAAVDEAWDAIRGLLGQLGDEEVPEELRVHLSHAGALLGRTYPPFSR